MKFKVPIAIAIIAAAMIGQAHAAFIKGEIHFSSFGAVAPTLTDGANPGGGAPVTTATGVKFGPGPNAIVTDPEIDFATYAFAGTPATFKSFTAGGAVADLWHLGNGTTLQFNLDAGSTTTFENSLTKSFTVTGTGVIVDNAGFYDPTPGEFSLILDKTTSASKFSFTSTTTAVPEPSTVIAGALLLLPFGASAIRSMRKKSVA